MLEQICKEYGIEIVSPTQRRPFVPMQTAAGSTLEKILRRVGEAHLRDVLKVLTESENNRHMLNAPVIKAVSRIMEENPTWYGRNATTFLEVMDRVDMAMIYEKARANIGVTKAHDTIAVMLLAELRKKFDPEPERLLL